MKQLLILVHAPSPNTVLLRDAVVSGAKLGGDGGINVTTKPPLDAGPNDVMAADGVILGMTENLGYMAGAMKDFFDRSYYPVLEEKQGLPYAAYIRAGLDGTGTSRAIDSIVSAGLRWNPVRPTLILKGDWDEQFVAQCEELGTLMGAGMDTGIF